MGQITINGVVKTVEDDVQKYVEDCERDTQNALAAAEGAKATITGLQNRVKQEIANGEMKVKAAEAKLARMGRGSSAQLFPGRRW